MWTCLEVSDNICVDIIFISDESMRLLVQGILSVSGESKKPELGDCIALRGTSLKSSQLTSSESGYMVDFSNKYQTDESYSQAVPRPKQNKCCPG